MIHIKKREEQKDREQNRIEKKKRQTNSPNIKRRIVEKREGNRQIERELEREREKKRVREKKEKKQRGKKKQREGENQRKWNKNERQSKTRPVFVFTPCVHPSKRTNTYNVIINSPITTNQRQFNHS